MSGIGLFLSTQYGVIKGFLSAHWFDNGTGGVNTPWNDLDTWNE